MVIAATNFPEVLDKALTRPGRFDRHVVVPNPDVKGRTQILNLHLSNVPVDKSVKVGGRDIYTPAHSPICICLYLSGYMYPRSLSNMYVYIYIYIYIYMCVCLDIYTPAHSPICIYMCVWILTVCVFVFVCVCVCVGIGGSSGEGYPGILRRGFSEPGPRGKSEQRVYAHDCTSPLTSENFCLFERSMWRRSPRCTSL